MGTDRRQESEDGGRWPGKQTRLVLLNVAFLLALLCAQVVFTNKYAEPNVLLRIFGWIVCVYSVVVLALAARWAMLAHRFHKTQTVSSSTVDELTGLPNWKGLLEELARPGYSEADAEHQTRLLYVKLLGLENANYEHGRTVGDLVLQRFADFLGEIKPEESRLCRASGTEFLVVAPHATASSFQELSADIGEEMSDFTVDLGSWGVISGLGVRSCVIPYVPGQTSLHKALQRVKPLARPVQSGVEYEDGDQLHFFHIPQITLEAFAAHRWETLPGDHRARFNRWRWEDKGDIVDVLVTDIMRVLGTRVQRNDFNFVTIPPFPASADNRGPAAAQAMAKGLAEQLGIPFRKVLKTEAKGASDTHQLHAKLDADVQEGSGVLLVQDILTSTRMMRRSVRELSESGCHVLVLVWAIKWEEIGAVEEGEEDLLDEV